MQHKTENIYKIKGKGIPKVVICTELKFSTGLRNFKTKQKLWRRENVDGIFRGWDISERNYKNVFYLRLNLDVKLYTIDLDLKRKMV